MQTHHHRNAIVIALSLLISLGWSLARAQGSTTIYIPLLRTPGASQNPLHTGVATYYDATGEGNCSFEASPNNLMVAAISYEDYDLAAYCGAYVEAYGPKGTVTVRIVDKCPDAGCQAGHLDMSPQAFAQIADLAQGRVAITWRVVSPPLSGPIAYHFKDGSNQWWTAVQIRNHRNPIVKFEYRNAAGSWVNVARVDYNYFVQSGGMGPGPYSFRVTDSYGNLITDSGIVGGDNVTRSGSGQFPVGP